MANFATILVTVSWPFAAIVRIFYAAIVTMNRNVPAMMIIQIFVPVPFQSHIRDILQLHTSLCLTDS